MLDIGIQELLVLMVIALLVFGPDKLPELGRRLGRAMREFRRASDEFRSTIETNLNLHEESILPPSAPAAPSATATADGLASAPAAGLAAEPETAAAMAASGAMEPGDTPKGLVPDPIGPFEETDTAGIASREPFCTRRGAHLLHRTSCGWAGRIPDTERIALKAAAEGWELGLRPCPVCDPQDAAPTS
ncbi:MAG TPA: twin-arginine translocase TatA/TatE family subunit [Methylomirabilota bacterium]|nr:twin-arginine translocase TatA/TatE family subunit [Methylomirabilota bacterium]